MAEAKVSFVIQNKNYGCYLKQCIQSIKRQNILASVAHEIWGLDAGSTDNSEKIFKKEIGAFISTVGLTQAQALNLALKRSTGNYIAWINADDYYLPNYLETHLAAIQKNQNVSMAHSNFLTAYTPSFMLKKTVTKFLQIHNLEGWQEIFSKIKHNISPAGFYEEPSSIKELKNKCFICQPSVMIRKDYLAKVGGWNESLTYVMDYDLWFRLAQISRVAYIPQPTVVLRLHGKNLSVQKHRAIQKEADLIRQLYHNVVLWEQIVVET